MSIESLVRGFRRYGDRDAIIWRNRRYTYDWLAEAVEGWAATLDGEAVDDGAVVSLEADFSPNAVALFIALIQRNCVVVPMTTSVEPLKPEFRRVAEIELIIEIGLDDEPRFERRAVTADHEVLRALKDAGHPGLILFSSGSTGKNKASVHDFVPLLKKFELARHAWRTITFLLFDHVGGVNTLFYTLSNGGCVVTLQDRSPDAVCEAIDSFGVQLLPTSPTFLNLLLISEVHTRYDLSSLELVTYGTEVMPESTLKRFHELFPSVRLLQTYGLSEVGILRSKSRSSDSLWVKIGGEGFETRVVDGMLEIKAESTMLGYLNAPSPFTADGWFKTGDAVEVDGEYLRFLGRKEEIIIVGGEKVYPAEVESVMLQMDGVEEVVVSGEMSAITGQLVKARVKLSTDEDLKSFRRRMNGFCRDWLPGFKIPQKVVLADENLHGGRFKKIRREC
jgi:acyl-CoA synthetase (AMP-forming)/AMP-acid ligase II